MVKQSIAGQTFRSRETTCYSVSGQEGGHPFLDATLFTDKRGLI